MYIFTSIYKKYEIARFRKSLTLTFQAVSGVSFRFVGANILTYYKKENFHSPVRMKVLFIYMNYLLITFVVILFRTLLLLLIVKFDKLLDNRN